MILALLEMTLLYSVLLIVLPLEAATLEETGLHLMGLELLLVLVFQESGGIEILW